MPEGQLGRPIPLMTGDGSDLLRLAFVDEGCPGAEVAVGGCPAGGDRACSSILLDSLVPVSAVPRQDGDPNALTLSAECLELRAAAGLAAAEPSAQDLSRSVTRLRLSELPVLRAAADGGEDWSWDAGTAQATMRPGGVLGGNALAAFALRVRADDDLPTVTFYREFPGSDRAISRQGFAFLPVQFPGGLLGRDRNDRCLVDGKDCELPGAVDLKPGDDRLALEPTRMVLDACLAPPPCAVDYRPDAEDPTAAGSCARRPGPGHDGACDTVDGPAGGVAASLVLATGVSGLALFEDSATRLLGDLGALPTCAGIPPVGARACREPEDGVLHLPGWPAAGSEAAPIPVLRVRALGLVAGAVRSKADNPCTRLAERLDGAENQCRRYTKVAQGAGGIAGASPPYSAQPDAQDPDRRDLADDAAAILGEAFLSAGQVNPDPARWVRVHVIPATHPMVLSLRRDVSPEALEPDGLLGTVLFRDTDVVLDYTDANPGLRLRCLHPHEGDCLVLPDCRSDGDAACCYGAPKALLDEFAASGVDACCLAYSASDLAALQGAGQACQGAVLP